MDRSDPPAVLIKTAPYRPVVPLHLAVPSALRHTNRRGQRLKKKKGGGGTKFLLPPLKAQRSLPANAPPASTPHLYHRRPHRREEGGLLRMETPISGRTEGGKGPFQPHPAERRSFREALRPTAPEGEVARAEMSPSLLGPSLWADPSGSRIHPIAAIGALSSAVEAEVGR